MPPIRGRSGGRDGPKSAHDGSKMVPRWLPDGSRWPQDVPRLSKIHPALNGGGNKRERRRKSTKFYNNSCRKNREKGKYINVWRNIVIETKKNKINGEIIVPNVQLIDEDGKNLGVVSNTEARRQAEDSGAEIVF